MKWNFDEAAHREGTDCIKYDLREETFGRKNVIPMWVADMDFKTPEFIVNKFAKGSIMNYMDTGGQGISVPLLNCYDREWICFCPGIVPAHLCTLAFTRPGDSVMSATGIYAIFLRHRKSWS